MSAAGWIYEGHWKAVSVGSNRYIVYEASGKDQRSAEIALKKAMDTDVWEADFLVRVPRIKGMVSASRILVGESENDAQTSSRWMLNDFANALEALS